MRLHKKIWRLTISVLPAKSCAIVLTELPSPALRGEASNCKPLANNEQRLKLINLPQLVVPLWRYLLHYDWHNQGVGNAIRNW